MWILIIRITYHTYGSDGNLDSVMYMYFNPENVVFTISPSAIIFEQPIVNGQDILPRVQIDHIGGFKVEDLGEETLLKQIIKDLGKQR